MEERGSDIKINDIYDINSEAMILATLLYRPDYSASSEKLLPEYFHDDFNACVYYSICELYKRKINKIDFASIDTVIKEKYGINKYITQAACAEFLEMAQEFARDNLEDYKLFVGRVISSAYRRETYRRTEEIQRLCLKDGSEVLDVQEKFRGMIMELTEKFSVGEEDKLFGDVIKEMWANSRKRLKENGGVNGLQSKFTKLNEFCTFERSELIVVAAKRKEGKSAYCLSEALNQLEQGKKVLYLDTELRSSQFMERILSNKAKIDNHALKNNNLSVSETSRLTESIEWFSENRNLTHIYRPSWCQESIYSAVLYWTQKFGGIDLLIYDYMKSSGETGASEVYNSLGNLTNFLKNDIAGGFDIPVLAAAQLNRGGDVGDSFKIEMYASTILNITKKTTSEIENDNGLGYGDLGNYKLFVKCNRNGESMDSITHEYIDLNFTGEHFDFKNVANTPVEHPRGNPFN